MATTIIDRLGTTFGSTGGGSTGADSGTTLVIDRLGSTYPAEGGASTGGFTSGLTSIIDRFGTTYYSSAGSKINAAAGLTLFVDRLGTSFSSTGAVSTSGGVSTGGSTSSTAGSSSSTGSGIVDLYLMMVSVRGNATITWPPGWIELYQTNKSTFITGGAAYQENSTTPNLNIASSVDAVYGLLRFNNYVGTPEYSTVQESTVVDDNKFPNPPNLTPTWGSTQVNWIAVNHWAQQTTADEVFTYPQNYSGVIARPNPNVQYVSLYVANRLLTASSEDPNPWFMDSTGRRVVATIGVRSTAISASTSGVISPSSGSSTQSISVPDIHNINKIHTAVLSGSFGSVITAAHFHNLNKIHGAIFAAASTDVINLLIVSARGNTAITWPTGWTELYQTNKSTFITGGAAYIIGTPSDLHVNLAASVNSVWGMLRFNNYVGTPESDATQESTIVDNNRFPIPPNLTPSFPSTDTIYIPVVHWAQQTTANEATFFGSSYTGQLQVPHPDVQYVSLYTAYDVVNASSESPNAWTMTSSGKRVVATIGLRSTAISASTYGTVAAATGFDVSLPTS